MHIVYLSPRFLNILIVVILSSLSDSSNVWVISAFIDFFVSLQNVAFTCFFVVSFDGNLGIFFRIVVFIPEKWTCLFFLLALLVWGVESVKQEELSRLYVLLLLWLLQYRFHILLVYLYAQAGG